MPWLYKLIVLLTLQIFMIIIPHTLNYFLKFGFLSFRYYPHGHLALENVIASNEMTIPNALSLDILCQTEI